MIAFVLSVATLPFVRKLCLKKGVVDQPGYRKVHNKPIPRLGGLALFLSVIIPVLMLDFAGFYPVIVCGSLMFLLGLLDDLFNISPKNKLIAQLLIAISVFVLGVRIEILSNPFGAPFILGALSLPVSVLWIVGISNAVNFIDGLDGLAGGVITIIAITLGVVAFMTDQHQSALMALILAGAFLGFLLFNFHPARIFMGDSGALFAGFVLACLSITGVIKTVAISLVLPILIFSVPILDICFSVLRRLCKKRNPMRADMEHIHHKLIKIGFSQNRVVGFLYFISLLSGVIATLLIGGHALYIYLMAFITLFMAIFYFIAKLRIFKELKQAQQK